MNFDHSHKRTRDADEQAASVHDWDQRYEQLSAGRFDGVVDELRVGPVQVFAECANQTVMQAGHLSPDRMSIALVRADGVPGWYCGHRLSGEHLIGIPSQGDFDLVASAGLQICPCFCFVVPNCGTLAGLVVLEMTVPTVPSNCDFMTRTCN